MIVFFLACLDPSGTVVGNPGTGSIYQSRTTLAESEGFIYTEASIHLQSISYYDNTGLLETEEYDQNIDLLNSNSNISLLGGTFTQLTFLFSQTDPMLLSVAHDEIGEVNLEIPIQELTFAREAIKIIGPSIVEIGSRNWLNLDNIQNTAVLKSLLEYSSNMYSDENENGELEEEEQENSITEPEEVEEYVLEGTWTADEWTLNNNKIYQGISLNLSPDGFLFQAQRKINQESGTVLETDIVQCNGITYPEEITKQGPLQINSFASGALEAQNLYHFLDNDTLIINYISTSENLHNIVYRSDSHTPVSFDVPMPEDSTIDIIALQNVQMGSPENPAHTTTASLSAKACLPNDFTVEVATGQPDKVIVTGENKEIWMRIPPQQIDTIQVDARSEIHMINSESTWDNLSLNIESDYSSSFRGEANNMFVFNSGTGDISFFGSAQQFSLTSMGGGTVHAFEFPAHSIDVEVFEQSSAEIHLLQDEDLTFLSGVFGMVGDGGQLSIISDPTPDTSLIEVNPSGTGTITLVCLEENPPEQCANFN